MNTTTKFEMAQTNSAIKKEVKRFIGYFPFKQRKYVTEFLKKRIQQSGRLTRAYFTRKVAEYIKQSEWGEDDIKLAFIAEVSTCITYLENQIVDRKKGVTTPEAINKNLISSQILKCTARKYSIDSFPEIGSMIIQKADKIFCLFSHGEYIEQDWLQYRNLVLLPYTKYENERPIPKYIDNQVRPREIMKLWRNFANKHLDFHVPDSIMRNYFRRTFLINTVLYEEITYTLLYLYNQEIKSFAGLRDFSRGYGIIQQITNDIIDFVPVNWIEKEKEYHNYHTFEFSGKDLIDNYADIRNGLLTLPSILYLCQNSSRDSLLTKVLQRKALSASYQEDLMKDNTLREAIKLSRLFVNHLHDYFQKKLRPDYQSSISLIDLLGVGIDNKYYQIQDKYFKTLELAQMISC